MCKLMGCLLVEWMGQTGTVHDYLTKVIGHTLPVIINAAEDGHLSTKIRLRTITKPK